MSVRRCSSACSLRLSASSSSEDMSSTDAPSPASLRRNPSQPLRAGRLRRPPRGLLQELELARRSERRHPHHVRRDAVATPRCHHHRLPVGSSVLSVTVRSPALGGSALPVAATPTAAGSAHVAWSSRARSLLRFLEGRFLAPHLHLHLQTAALVPALDLARLQPWGQFHPRSDPRPLHPPGWMRRHRRGRRIFADRCPRSRRVRARVRARHACSSCPSCSLSGSAPGTARLSSADAASMAMYCSAAFRQRLSCCAWQRNFVVLLRIKPRTLIAGFAIGALGGDTLCSICGR